MNAITINYFAVLVAAIIRMAVGFFWYSPPMLLKPWLIMAFVLASLIAASNITDWLNGALVGFWVWLGFMATLHVSLWGYENRPLKLIAINLGNNLIALLLMGALLAVWR